MAGRVIQYIVYGRQTQGRLLEGGGSKQGVGGLGRGAGEKDQQKPSIFENSVIKPITLYASLKK